MKHTPGPWTVSGQSIIAPDGRTQVASTGTMRAADARLIAAAPALLAALRDIIESEDSTLLDGGSLLGDDYREQARAAIAAAEGKT